MSYTVRTLLKESDPQLIQDITESTGYFRADEVDVAKELAEVTLSDIDSYDFLFIETDGKDAGYSCFGEIPCTIGSYDLYWIAVHKTFQNAGLGSIILKETENIIRAKNGRCIYIETSGKDQYISTRKFYEKNGYTVAAVFPDFYDINDSKYVYFKKL